MKRPEASFFFFFVVVVAIYCSCEFTLSLLHHCRDGFHVQFACSSFEIESLKSISFHSAAVKLRVETRRK